MAAADRDLINGRDLDFLLWEWLKLEHLLGRPRFVAHDRDSIAATLDMTHRLARDKIAPHARLLDVEEPRFESGAVIVPAEAVAAVRAIADAGLLATIFDESVGGLQLPYLVHTAALALQMAGSVGIAFFGMLTVGSAALIATYGTPAQVDAFVTPALAGRALGTMCLSEANAGSSLADIRTLAAPDGRTALGQRYRLTGEKMWISGGEHAVTDQIVHLVLAKIAAPDGSRVDGTRSVSLFIVPKMLPDGSRNDVAATGINHKLGSAHCPTSPCASAPGTTDRRGRLARSGGWSAKKAKAWPRCST